MKYDITSRFSPRVECCEFTHPVLSPLGAWSIQEKKGWVFEKQCPSPQGELRPEVTREDQRGSHMGSWGKYQAPLKIYLYKAATGWLSQFGSIACEWGGGKTFLPWLFPH